MSDAERLFWFPDRPDELPGYAEHCLRESIITALQENLTADRIREIVDEEAAQWAKEAH
jgi:hypothetical protein